jgi:uncharacterized delta-60 repeat protein
MSNISKLMMQSASGNAGDIGSYWIHLYGGAALDAGYNVTTDSGLNIIAVGVTQSTGQGSNDILVTKHSPDGELLWSKILGGANAEVGWNVAVDSSDNIYIVGYTSSSGSGNYDALIVKYNSDGVLQWQRTLGSTSSDYGRGVAVDSSDNVYMFGDYYSTAQASKYLFLAKYNSSGTLQWQNRLGSNVDDTGYKCVIDSTGNIYACGYSNVSGGAGNADILLIKYDSSGTELWKRLYGGVSIDYGYGLAVDSSDKIIITGRTYTTATNTFVLKVNSSDGTIVFDRLIGGSAGSYGMNVATDSSDNIYTISYTSSYGEGSNEALIVKYNSSGTVQWSNTIGGIDNDIGYGIAVDANDNLAIGMYGTSDGAGGYDRVVARLPNDGTGTGTYGSLVYQNITLTIDQPNLGLTLNTSFSMPPDSTVTLTDAASNLVDASASLTEEFFEIIP